jgi:PAS domain-containing protein
MKPCQMSSIDPVETTEQKHLNAVPESGIPWKRRGPYLSERQWGTVPQSEREKTQTAAGLEPMKPSQISPIDPVETTEQNHLNEVRESGIPWKKRGHYLSERQWGTVPEDHSQNGDAWNTVSTPVNGGRGIGYTVRVAGEIVRARKYYWPELRKGGTAAIALANKGIERIKPHISVLLKKAALVGQRTQESLVKAGDYVQARRYYWAELRKGGAVIIAVTSVGIAKSTAYLAQLLERTSVHLRHARQALASDKQKMEKVVAARKADLEAGYAAAMVASNRGLKKAGAQIYMPLEYGTRSIQRAGHKVANAGREIASKPRRIREARRAREIDLLNLMATSLDAIVVTDDEHRVVAANTNALQLFGVSQANIRNFTLDSFIVSGRVAGFKGHGASFGSTEMKKGNCKIRRLDGKVRLVEYEFTASHVPSQHLCIFRSVTSKPVGSIARTDTVHS